MSDNTDVSRPEPPSDAHAAPPEGAAAETPLGRFNWCDVMTTDVAAARDFYGRVAGWETTIWQNSAGSDPYEMWMNGETPVGGLMGLPQPEAPPCWLAYVSTPDLDATLARVKALGGAVHHVVQLDEVGRWAVIADPQGAVIALLEPETYTPGGDDPPLIGEFSWFELMTSDASAAWDFYRRLFGWQEHGLTDMGEMGMYRAFSRGAHPLGGMYALPHGGHPAWLLYIRVADVHAAADAVRELGGKILNGPIEVPGGDFVAQCMDPQGVAFAVHATE